MIKKFILFFCIIATTTGTATGTEIDMLDIFSKMSKASIEQKKPFFKKWEKYLISTLSVNQQSYSDAVYKSRDKWLKHMDLHNTNLNSAMSKSNKYSDEWVNRIKSKISDEELKKRRLEISKTLFYLMLKSKQPYLVDSGKEVIYYGRAYFTLVDEYFELFIGYHKKLPEKERNDYLYNIIIEGKELLKRRQLYHLAIVDTRFILLGAMVENLENKDVYNLLSAEEVFQKPFDFFKALNDLYR